MLFSLIKAGFFSQFCHVHPNLSNINTAFINGALGQQAQTCKNLHYGHGDVEIEVTLPCGSSSIKIG
jgi:hypothetical protein